MTAVRANGDVWVIQYDEACLYRPRDNTWVLESTMSFSDFHGSAVALASFALPDTQVYLNLHQDKLTACADLQPRWLRIDEDPLRVEEFSHTAEHEMLLRTIKDLGKKSKVIASANPANFHKSTSLFLCSHKEAQHVKAWIRSRKGGESSRVANLKLIFQLWAQADRARRNLRLCAVLCTAAATALMHGFHNTLLQQIQADWAKSAVQVMQAEISQPNQFSFTSWAAQIRKFGQHNRSNLASLNIYWESNGEVHTYAELDRARKRLPKGCKQAIDLRVACTSKDALP